MWRPATWPVNLNSYCRICWLSYIYKYIYIYSKKKNKIKKCYKVEHENISSDSVWQFSPVKFDQNKQIHQRVVNIIPLFCSVGVISRLRDKESLPSAPFRFHLSYYEYFYHGQFLITQREGGFFGSLGMQIEVTDSCQGEKGDEFIV